MEIFLLLPLRARKSDNAMVGIVRQTKRVIRKVIKLRKEANKIKSDNFLGSFREKTNIAIAVLEK